MLLCIRQSQNFKFLVYTSIQQFFCARIKEGNIFTAANQYVTKRLICCYTRFPLNCFWRMTLWHCTPCVSVHFTVNLDFLQESISGSISGIQPEILLKQKIITKDIYLLFNPLSLRIDEFASFYSTILLIVIGKVITGITKFIYALKSPRLF